MDATFRGRVRLLFQPAEEVMPGGALAMLEQGALEGVDQIFGLHCDPTVTAGQIGVKVGAITSSADIVEVRLHAARVGTPRGPTAPSTSSTRSPP